MTEQNAPERIWADLEVGTWFDGEPYSEGDTEYVRADLYDAAIRREKALLASNDDDRKGLVEAASLRHRLKVMTAERDAAWNEAIEAAAERYEDGFPKWDTFSEASSAILSLRREPSK